MELPSLGQFRALLQEDILFCDYLNTFLNLPVCDPHFSVSMSCRVILYIPVGVFQEVLVQQREEEV